jgi:hypothetical protein
MARERRIEVRFYGPTLAQIEEIERLGDGVLLRVADEG